MTDRGKMRILTGLAAALAVVMLSCAGPERQTESMQAESAQAGSSGETAGEAAVPSEEVRQQETAKAPESAELPTQPEEEPGRIIENWFPGSTPPDPDKPTEGTMIPGYGSAVMNAGDRTLKLTIGNPLGNRVGFLAELTLEDGTVLYSSPLLEPGQAILLLPLERTLEKGTYKAMVKYNCVTLDRSHQPLNAGISGFTLYVQ
jgi:hypothetical protein